MTLDRSLKVKAGAIKARNVLTRAERIAQLQSQEKFNEEDNILGMPKVRVMKVSFEEEEEGQEGRGREVVVFAHFFPQHCRQGSALSHDQCSRQ